MKPFGVLLLCAAKAMPGQCGLEARYARGPAHRHSVSLDNEVMEFLKRQKSVLEL
jgi:hypothetical protein